MEGARHGIAFMLYPDFSKLFTVKIWTEAATQTFFQYSIGIGVGQTLSSFRNVDAKVFQFAKFCPILNAMTGILASLVVFGYLGHFAEVKGVNIDDLPINGPSLLFVTYPGILSTMPFQNLWLILFFLTMILLGIDTQFGNVEVVVTYIKDQKFKYKGRA